VPVARVLGSIPSIQQGHLDSRSSAQGALSLVWGRLLRQNAIYGGMDMMSGKEIAMA